LTEYDNYWYNDTISISTNLFSLGNNYVYVKFELSNYTLTTFSFQILVKQIEIDVQTIDFIDSISVYSGEIASIWINLTESNSNIPLENATVYCYWEFGTYHFEYVGDGLYHLDFEVPASTLGPHRFNLVISTEGSIYKTAEYSFLIIVSQKQLPEYVIWIIVVSMIALIALLGALSLRSYVFQPRRRRRELLIADKTQPYKDLMNIQAVLISNRSSGVSLYNKTFSILDEAYITGFSGFIQAITILGKHYTKNGVKMVDIESGADDTDEEQKEIKELDFNFFHSLICDYGNLRVVLLLRERSSEQLRRRIDLLTKDLYSQCRDLINNFDGDLTKVKPFIEEIFLRHLPLFYKGDFILNQTKHYKKAKNLGTFSSLEIRILNVLESQSKYKARFLLEDILSMFEDVDEDRKILSLEALISHRMIKPII
ncbi:MAG: hypothetical protein ACFE96_19065, partial [Candidatus Hermodarchaeota archaeon]